MYFFFLRTKFGRRKTKFENGQHRSISSIDLISTPQSVSVQPKYRLLLIPRLRFSVGDLFLIWFDWCLFTYLYGFSLICLLIFCTNFATFSLYCSIFSIHPHPYNSTARRGHRSMKGKSQPQPTHHVQIEELPPDYDEDEGNLNAARTQ